MMRRPAISCISWARFLQKYFFGSSFHGCSQSVWPVLWQTQLENAFAAYDIAHESHAVWFLILTAWIYGSKKFSQSIAILPPCNLNHFVYNKHISYYIMNRFRKSKGLQNEPFRNWIQNLVRQGRNTNPPSTFLLIQNWLSKPITISIQPDQLIRKEKWPCGCGNFTDQAELALKVPWSSWPFRVTIKTSAQKETEAILQHQQFPDGEIKTSWSLKKSPLSNSLSGEALTTERFWKETAAGLVVH